MGFHRNPYLLTGLRVSRSYILEENVNNNDNDHDDNDDDGNNDNADSNNDNNNSDNDNYDYDNNVTYVLINICVLLKTLSIQFLI